MEMIPTIHAISDMHFAHEDVMLRGGDILLIAGDFMGHGLPQELTVFNEWLGRQPYKHRIVVAGNHDWACEDASLAQRTLSNCIYLNHESAIVMGLKIFGSQWTPTFGSWAFMYDRGSELSVRLWMAVPLDTDILVTHGPAQGSGVSIVKGRTDDVGCWDLRHRICQLPQLKAHVCGHIHSGYGVGAIGDVKCYNVSVADERYDIVNPPSVITW